MKRLVACLIGCASVALPLFAFASSGFTDTQNRLLQLTAVLASIEAQIEALETGSPLACAVQFASGSVKAGSSVAFGWGSVGAIDPAASSTALAQNASEMLTLSQAGTWKYSLTFWSAAGASTTCSASIRVLS